MARMTKEEKLAKAELEKAEALKAEAHHKEYINFYLLSFAARMMELQDRGQVTNVKLIRSAPGAKNEPDFKVIADVAEDSHAWSNSFYLSSTSSAQDVTDADVEIKHIFDTIRQKEEEAKRIANLRKTALAKLNDEEKEVLGIRVGYPF